MGDFKYPLGQAVRDIVTEVRGIVTARTEWLNGCRRYAVSRPVNEKGEVPEDIWVDEGQLRFDDIDRASIPLSSVRGSESVGGPMRDPSLPRDR